MHAVLYSALQKLNFNEIHKNSVDNTAVLRLLNRRDNVQYGRIFIVLQVYQTFPVFQYNMVVTSICCDIYLFIYI